MASIFQKKKNVVFLAVFYTFLWGTAFPLVKLCMEGFGVTDNLSKCLVAGIRFLISGSALLLYALFKEPDGIKLNKNQLKYSFFYGVCGTAIQYALTYIGLSSVDGSKGAIFDQLCVFIVIISSGIFFKNDGLTIKKILGCIIGFLGIIAVSTERVGLSFSFKGEGMMILAAICQAVAYFIAKASTDKVSAAKLVGYGQLVGGIILVFMSLILGAKIPNTNSVGIITLLSLSAISAIAYVLSLIPLKYFPASEISVFNLLITVFGVVMSAALLGENVFRLNYLFALILVSLGILLVNSNTKTNTKKL